MYKSVSTSHFFCSAASLDFKRAHCKLMCEQEHVQKKDVHIGKMLIDFLTGTSVCAQTI